MPCIEKLTVYRQAERQTELQTDRYSQLYRSFAPKNLNMKKILSYASSVDGGPYAELYPRVEEGDAQQQHVPGYKQPGNIMEYVKNY